jgi:hypothetical protein
MIRSLLVLTLCFALTGLVRAQQEKGKNKGKQQTTQRAVTATSNVGQGKKYQTLSKSSQVQQQNVSTQNNRRVRSNTQLQSNFQLQSNTGGNVGKYKKQKWSGQNAQTPVQSNARVQSNTQLQANTKPWKVRKFTLQKNTGIAGVRFGASTRIVGAQNWQGANYNAFRIYTSQRHDRNSWTQRHSRFVLVSGGYYYWDNGYWYPAWGYDPAYEFYAYDGPIYGYNDLPPDQVIANVQAALQTQGYYRGEIDGLLGPLTRAALAEYQSANGLYPTSAIDEPTLESLGMV